MLTLKNCAFDEAGRAVAVYQAKDVEPGKGGTTLTVDVELTTHADGAAARLVMEPAGAQTEEDAFEALAQQLERAARAIRARGEPKFCVPAYGA